MNRHVAEFTAISKYRGQQHHGRTESSNSHFGRFDPPRAVLGLTASLRLLTGYLTGWNSKTTHVYAPPYGFTPPTPPKRQQAIDKPSQIATLSLTCDTLPQPGFSGGCF